MRPVFLCVVKQPRLATGVSALALKWSLLLMTGTQPSQRNRRPKKRELFCPAHSEQRIQGNGKKYYLHLLQPKQLKQRGISTKRNS